MTPLAATMANWEGLETAMAARFGGAVLGDDRGFRFRSGLTSGFTNAVLRTSVAPDALAALVADARAWFPAGVAWRWLVSDLDCPADLAARLPALGFERRRVLPAMARDLAGLDVGARRHADVTEVRDAVDLEAWLAVRNANHPLDERTWDAWRASGTPGAGGPFRQFVARDGDRPIGSVTLFVDEATDSAGLYHVDVVPQARGRGIGTAVTLAALGAARAAGVNRAVLTATEAGARLYRGLGFEVVGEVTVFGGSTS